MGWLHDIERRLENVVNGVFARAFRSEVEPIEIATRLSKELDSQAKLLNRDKKLVPNNFTVFLSQHDYDELAPMARAINDDIVPEMRRHAGERKYVFNGPIRIDYACDETLTVGRFRVESEAVATVAETGGAASTTAIKRHRWCSRSTACGTRCYLPDSPSAAAARPTCGSTILVSPESTPTSSSSRTPPATSWSASRTSAPPMA